MPNAHVPLTILAAAGIKKDNLKELGILFCLFYISPLWNVYLEVSLQKDSDSLTPSVL